MDVCDGFIAGFTLLAVTAFALWVFWRDGIALPEQVVHKIAVLLLPRKVLELSR